MREALGPHATCRWPATPSPSQKVKPTKKGNFPSKKHAVVTLASFQANGGQQRRPPAAIYLFWAANQKPSRVFDLQTRLGNNALPWRPANPHFCQEMVIFGHFSSHFCQLLGNPAPRVEFLRRKFVNFLSTFCQLLVNFLSTFGQLFVNFLSTWPSFPPSPLQPPNSHAPTPRTAPRSPTPKRPPHTTKHHPPSTPSI